MLQYKNHRIHCQGISFAIPEGYFLDTSYEEVPQDTLHLWTEDERLYVRIGLEYDTRGPLQELNFIIRELEECVVVKEPTAVIYGGLAGFKTTYSVGEVHYGEIRIAVPNKDAVQNDLLILVRGKGSPLEEKEINAIIAGIDPLWEIN